MADTDTDDELTPWEEHEREQGRQREEEIVARAKREVLSILDISYGKAAEALETVAAETAREGEDGPYRRGMVAGLRRAAEMLEIVRREVPRTVARE
jgi:hypothetical protein